MRANVDMQTMGESKGGTKQKKGEKRQNVRLLRLFGVTKYKYRYIFQFFFSFRVLLPHFMLGNLRCACCSMCKRRYSCKIASGQQRSQTCAKWGDYTTAKKKKKERKTINEKCKGEIQNKKKEIF